VGENRHPHRRIGSIGSVAAGTLVVAQAILLEAALNFIGLSRPSKGVHASHAHVVTFARDWIRAVEFIEGQAIYSCAPLFHAVASCSVVSRLRRAALMSTSLTSTARLSCSAAKYVKGYASNSSMSQSSLLASCLAATCHALADRRG
jgi:hypothetical protein